MFIHKEVDFDSMSRETIDGVRYYHIPGTDKLVRLPSITSVISHRNREKFKEWRKRVGEEEANNITRKATHRGTDAHTLIEEYLNNVDPKEMTKVLPLSEYLFKQLSQLWTRLITSCVKNRQCSVINLGLLDQLIVSLSLMVSCPSLTSRLPRNPSRVSGLRITLFSVQLAFMLYEMKGTSVKKFVIIMTCENGDVEVYEEYDKSKYIKLLTEYIREFVQFKLQEYAKA